MDKKINRSNLFNLFISLLSLIIGATSMGIVLLSFALIALGRFEEENFFSLFLGIFLSLQFFIAFRMVKICLNAIKTNKIVAKSGYSQELFDLLNRRIKKSKSKLNLALNQLTLASFLESAKRVDEALEVMNKIDFNSTSGIIRAEYFNCYAWLFISKGDNENALRVLNDGQSILQSYRYHKIMGAAIAHTLGVYEYLIENYYNAERILLEAKSKSRFDTSITSCDLFLCLIYLKTNRKELARDLAFSRVGKEGNPRNKEDLQKLIVKINRAFEGGSL